jgi:hypothetical protein
MDTWRQQALEPEYLALIFGKRGPFVAYRVVEDFDTTGKSLKVLTGRGIFLDPGDRHVSLRQTSAREKLRLSGAF